MRVSELFIKCRHDAPMQSVRSIACSTRGIAEGVPCAPFRQALITSRAASAELGFAPGDLRENIVVDCAHLYDLPSGTVIQIGQALLRLTFHCEPCKKLPKRIAFDRIVHRRGVFGMFMNEAVISVGDGFFVTGQRLEEIPYGICERIGWYLTRNKGRAAALDLVHALGLPATSGRMMPRLLAKVLCAPSAVEADAGD